MKRLFLFLAALLLIVGLMAGCATTAPPPAAAAPIAAPALSGDDAVASDGRDSIRLTQHPCPQAILVALPPEMRRGAKAAVGTIGGQTFTACWEVAGGSVFLLYEDGDQGMVPLSQFRRFPGV